MSHESSSQKPTPSPQTTLVTILGASQWPKWKALGNPKGGAPFLESARALNAYFLDQRGFNLPAENLLNLFDAEDHPDALDARLSTFLKTRTDALRTEGTPAKDLLVYYIGHGGFEGGASDFYLAIRNSRPESRGVSSLRMESLAKTIKDNSRHIRCYLILDCCFAGEAIESLQSPPLDLAQAKTEKAFKKYPNKGTALFCSSARDTASQAPFGRTYTMFSGALLRALREGSADEQDCISLQGLGDLTWDLIEKEYGADGVRPEVRPGYLGEGDITRVPLFPNFAAQPTSLAPVAPGELFEPAADVTQCYVVISESEQHGKGAGALVSVVRNALLKYKARIEGVSRKPLRETPHIVNIATVVSSTEQYANALLALCRAEVVVFDLTNYEPAVMLLMGVRAVVRRGVTLSSAGGEYAIGDTVESPFNIQEVNVISHSARQLKRSEPIDLIGRRIVEGFKQLGSLPNYLDLPAFDAVRNLPPDPKDRKTIGYKEQVMVLCSFSKDYQETNWKDNLLRFLPVYAHDDENDRDAEILRTLDMKSPRLVSQSLYEAIRQIEMCVADWTEWRANVFFELGVRLAASGLDPVCIIEDKYRTSVKALPGGGRSAIGRKRQNVVPDKVGARLLSTAGQRARLLELFDPISYTCSLQGDTAAYEGMVARHREMLDASGPVGGRRRLPAGFTYQTVTTNIDWRVEFGTKPVYRELADAANLLSSPEVDSAGRSPILYPGNADLVERTEGGALERRLAAWYYLDRRYSRDEILSSAELTEQYESLGDRLVSYLLGSGLEAYQVLGDEIDGRMADFRGFRRNRSKKS